MSAIQLELPGMAEVGSAVATPIDLVAAPQEYVAGGQPGAVPASEGSKLLCAPEDPADFAAELERIRNPLPKRVNVNPDDVERGLSQLVMTVIELLRQLMERQALRRMEAGTIDDDQIERLGEAFMKLERRMEELKEIFGLSDEDLNLDLGPLGKLL